MLTVVPPEHMINLLLQVPNPFERDGALANGRVERILDSFFERF